MFIHKNQVPFPVYIPSPKQTESGFSHNIPSLRIGHSYSCWSPSSSVGLCSSWIISRPAGVSSLPRCQWFRARPLAAEVRWGQSSLCKAGLLDRKKERERDEEEDERAFLNEANLWFGLALLKKCAFIFFLWNQSPAPMGRLVCFLSDHHWV